MRNAYDKWLAGEGCCNANNFIHIESADCKKEDVCECERILLEISNLHTDDLVLQDEIDYISGITDTKLDASAYTPTDLSDYYTKEEVDELIPDVPSLSGYATEQWVLDKHYITGVDLSDYATKEEIPSLSGYATEQWVENKGYLTEHQPLKTINGQVISGTGNIEIEASGSPITVDSALSFISTNPVQNKVITEALNDKLDASAYTPTDLSNYVTKSELNQYITSLQQQINSLIAAVSGCCGSSGETQYRWITMTGENDYWCSGTTKMSKEKEQSSTDGINWTDTGNIRSGSTVLEENCVDCGYSGGSRIQNDYLGSSNQTKIANVCSSNVERVSINSRPNPITYDNCITTVNSALTTGNTVTTDKTTTTIENGEYANTDLLWLGLSTEITEIGEYAFSGNTQLSGASIGGFSRLEPFSQNPVARIASVGDYAFKDCANLKTIGFAKSDSVPTLGTGVFDGCTSLATIYVKNSMVNTFKAAWPQYASLIVGI